MSTALGLALLSLGAPLAAAALAVVIPPLRTRGAPAAGITVASSILATLASLVLLRIGPGPGSATSLAVPWMVVQGRTLGEVGVRLDGVSMPMLQWGGGGIVAGALVGVLVGRIVARRRKV